MFNTIDSASAAIRRARKALAHSMRQLDEAQTPRAARRHARRVRNAERQLNGARFDFEAMAYQDA